MHIHIKSHKPPYSEIETDVDVPPELWRSASPLRVTEHIARELARRWATSMKFDYDDPPTLNYYASMVSYLLPRIREVMLKRLQENLRERAEA